MRISLTDRGFWFAHLNGVWVYLRLGLLVSACIFIMAGLMALADKFGAAWVYGAATAFVVMVGAFTFAWARPARNEPPIFAAFLLYLAKPRAPELLRELHDSFQEIVARVGQSAARVWYWAQVARIAASTVSTAVRVFADVGTVIARLISSITRY
jgi:hypothetical protein